MPSNPNLNSILSDIASSIRALSGKSDKIPTIDLAKELALISSSENDSFEKPSSESDLKKIFKDIADVTRLKLGTSDQIKSIDLADAISNIVIKNPILFGNHLTFESRKFFDINIEYLDHDGTLQYSYDGISWKTWFSTTSGIGSKQNTNGNYYLLLRGTDISYFTVLDDNNGLKINGSNVKCRGNIETLLDYSSVENSKHPTMASGCFEKLFKGCSSLISAPELPATRLSNGCYRSMFENCTNLISSPVLPAKNLSDYCYQNMFKGCTNLVDISTLPATTLSNGCYYGMYENCTKLANPPKLPSLIVKLASYQNMFKGCTNLVNPPELPATTLTGSCYNSMFYDCTNLKSVPVLLAKTLATECYKNMFYNCNKIKISQIQNSEYIYKWRIPNEGTGSEELLWNTNMLSNTGGTFTGDPEINTTYYTNVKPIGYVEPTSSGNFLTFESDSTFSMKRNSIGNDGTLEYSTDGEYWSSYTGIGTINAGLHNNGKYYLCLRGSNNTHFSSGSGTGNPLLFSGENYILCKGNIETLLDYKTVESGRHPVMGNYCFKGLFYDSLGKYNTLLNFNVSLPSTDLSLCCYQNMFRGTDIQTLPKLPATVLTDACYADMFANCFGIILKSVGSSVATHQWRLPSSGNITSVGNGSLTGMFDGILDTDPQINTTYYTNNQPI